TQVCSLPNGKPLNNPPSAPNAAFGVLSSRYFTRSSSGSDGSGSNRMLSGNAKPPPTLWKTERSVRVEPNCAFTCGSAADRVLRACARASSTRACARRTSSLCSRARASASCTLNRVRAAAACACGSCAESPAGTSGARRTAASSRRIRNVLIDSGSFPAGPMAGRHVQPSLLSPQLRCLPQRPVQMAEQRGEAVQPRAHARVLRGGRVQRRLQQIAQLGELPAPLLQDPVVQLLMDVVVVPPVPRHHRPLRRAQALQQPRVRARAGLADPEIRGQVVQRERLRRDQQPSQEQPCGARQAVLLKLEAHPFDDVLRGPLHDEPSLGGRQGGEALRRGVRYVQNILKVPNKGSGRPDRDRARTSAEARSGPRPADHAGPTSRAPTPQGPEGRAGPGRPCRRRARTPRVQTPGALPGATRSIELSALHRTGPRQGSADATYGCTAFSVSPRRPMSSLRARSRRPRRS